MAVSRFIRYEFGTQKASPFDVLTKLVGLFEIPYKTHAPRIRPHHLGAFS